MHVCSVAKSCPVLCNPMDYSPSGSSVHGISQARVLKWVAISFSRRSSQPRDGAHVSCIDRGTALHNQDRGRNFHGSGSFSKIAIYKQFDYKLLSLLFDMTSYTKFWKFLNKVRKGRFGRGMTLNINSNKTEPLHRCPYNI